MNWISQIADKLDPYERKARIFPGLLVVLPLLVPVVAVFGPKNPLMTAVVGLIGGCGAIYAMGSIARGRGKAVEERLISKWGGMPTTIMLRHRDRTLEAPSRNAYRELFRTRLGIELPTAAEESANPEQADDAYKGAVRQLREATRGKAFGLLLKENIAYGFHRNMLGVRPWGWLTSSLGVVIGLVMSGAVVLRPTLSIDLDALMQFSLGAGLTLGVAIPMFVGWFHFSEKAVHRISVVYSERLFESLKSLPTQRKPRK
jgi:hypothetical protein